MLAMTQKRFISLIKKQLKKTKYRKINETKQLSTLSKKCMAVQVIYSGFY